MEKGDGSMVRRKDMHPNPFHAPYAKVIGRGLAQLAHPQFVFRRTQLRLNVSLQDDCNCNKTTAEKVFLFLDMTKSIS